MDQNDQGICRTADEDLIFAEDLLRGAAEIAQFLYGDKVFRRRIYHLYKTSKHFPAFKIGCRICARKSVLRAWIQQGEKKLRH